LVDLTREVRVDEQVVELGVLLERLRDLLEEPRADDAAAAEDLRDRRQVEVPLVVDRRLRVELEALRVAAQLAAVERVADGLDRDLDALTEAGAALEDLRRANALVLLGG